MSPFLLIQTSWYDFYPPEKVCLIFGHLKSSPRHLTPLNCFTKGPDPLVSLLEEQLEKQIPCFLRANMQGLYSQLSGMHWKDFGALREVGERKSPGRLEGGGGLWRERAQEVGVGTKEKVCLLHSFPLPHSVGPARPWQMVLQKSGDLCFTVYDKALPVIWFSKL